MITARCIASGCFLWGVNCRLSYCCTGAGAPCLPLRLAKSRPSGGCSHAQRLRALVMREVPRRVVLRAANQNRMIAGGNHTLIYRRERNSLQHSVFSLPQSASLTIACGQSGRGADSPPDCHSLPRLRFAYPRQRGPLWCGGHRNDKLQFEVTRAKKVARQIPAGRYVYV